MTTVAAHKGAITYPRGFVAAGTHAGFKKKRKDLGILYSFSPAVAAGVFTTNRVQAAPVIVSRRHIAHRSTRAVIVNSGNANACLGPAGMRSAERMAAAAAGALGVATAEVLVASTGVIGRPFDAGIAERAIGALVKTCSSRGGRDFAQAIMTTDTFSKEVVATCRIGDREVRIGGTTKGAGMIAPCMKGRHATMLCFVTTDAAITKSALQSALQSATEASFNSISVDGDMSTNDSLFVLANGMAQNQVITARGDAWRVFEAALRAVCQELAKMIVRDGEGATKLVEIVVRGARSIPKARSIAACVSRSLLVKTCIYGEDPNWGRVLAALGYAGEPFSLERVSIAFGDEVVFKKGGSCITDYRRLQAVLKKKDVRITIDLHEGAGAWTFWTCDLTHEYVTVNSAYTT